MAIKNLVDELGRIKAQLADLAAREDHILSVLKARGEGRRLGALFEANIFQSCKSTTDWDTLARIYKISPRDIAKLTSTKDFLVCKVTARQLRSSRRKEKELRVS